MEYGDQSGVRAGWLLCLLLFIGGAGFGVQAVADEVLGGQDGGQQPRHSERSVPAVDSTGPGLTKVLTTKHPRRTDIPDAFLIIMLALIGVVVISRRGVTGKEEVPPPEKD